MHSLNKQTIDMRTITKAALTDQTVNFEFGIADADTFNFLDEEEFQRIKNILKQQALPVLDVFCVARYHTQEPGGKRKSLKFDYNMLRFTFGKNNIELFVYHERGTQRIPLEDLVTFIQNQINKRLAQEKHKTLVLKKVVKSQLMFGLQQP